jgi:uncharacterized protein
MSFTRRVSVSSVIFLCTLALFFCDAVFAQANVPQRCPEFDLPEDFDVSTEGVSRLYKGSPPLVWALLEKNPDKLRKLLKAGANPNICAAGSSLLALTAVASLPRDIEILISYGANPDYPLDNTGRSPLFAALGAMKYDTAFTLAAKGANVKLTSDTGFTVLHDLSFVPIHQKQQLADQQIAFANELIRRGVDINAQEKRGNTALIFASLFNNKKLVEFFLQKGADTKLQSARGETALSYAEKKGYTDIADLLRKAEAIDSK